jgi:hypothetical protein
MEITVDRKWKKDTYTIGVCYINGVRFSETLEDKDRGLDNSMSESIIKSKKIYGQTAIPTGTYEIKMTYSPKFANRAWAKKYSGKVVEITNVKAYSGVRIHPFNTAAESLGCIAVGRNLVKGKVLQSTIYYQKLVDDYISPALKRGEKVTITIK